VPLGCPGDCALVGAQDSQLAALEHVVYHSGVYHREGYHRVVPRGGHALALREGHRWSQGAGVHLRGTHGACPRPLRRRESVVEPQEGAGQSRGAAGGQGQERGACGEGGWAWVHRVHLTAWRQAVAVTLVEPRSRPKSP